MHIPRMGQKLGEKKWVKTRAGAHPPPLVTTHPAYPSAQNSVYIAPVVHAHVLLFPPPPQAGQVLTAGSTEPEVNCNQTRENLSGLYPFDIVYLFIELTTRF